MASLTLAFLFSLWFIHLATAQFPLITSGEERLGSCTERGLVQGIGGVYPEPSLTDGLLPLSLVEESMRMYSPGDSLYTDDSPRVRIFSYKIVCRSNSSSNDGYSSVAILAFYSCRGTACTRDQNIGSNVERNYTTFFSLFCDSDEWVLQSALTSIGFGGGNDRSPTNSVSNPEIAEDAKCSVCTSDQNDAAKFSSSYNRATGCVCML